MFVSAAADSIGRCWDMSMKAASSRRDCNRYSFPKGLLVSLAIVPRAFCELFGIWPSVLRPVTR
jgi:hypothetical protein